jgi:WhiB family redox-sensing transcriptional regulator
MPSMAGVHDRPLPGVCCAPMSGGRRCLLKADHRSRWHRGTPRGPSEQNAAATLHVAALIATVEAGGWPRWRADDDPLCARSDPSLFDPEPDERTDQVLAKVAEATGICGQCTLRRRCLESAVARGEQYGVWGGVSEVQLRRFVRRRNRSRQRSGQVTPAAA